LGWEFDGPYNEKEILQSARANSKFHRNKAKKVSEMEGEERRKEYQKRKTMMLKTTAQV
jgi:hypothetical protein